MLHVNIQLSLDDAVKAAKEFARTQDLRLHDVEGDEWRRKVGTITSPINDPTMPEYQVVIGEIPIGGYC